MLSKFKQKLYNIFLLTTIKKRTLFLIVSIIVLTIVLFLTLFSVSILKINYNSANVRNYTYLQNISGIVEEYSKSVEQLSQNLFYEDFFKNYEDYMQSEGFYNKMREALINYLRYEDYVKSISFVSIDGNVCSTSTDISENYTDFKQLINKHDSEQNHTSWHCYNKGTVGQVYMVRTVYNINGNEIGNLIFTISTEFIDNIIKRNNFDYPSYFVVINDERIVFSNYDDKDIQASRIGNVDSGDGYLNFVCYKSYVSIGEIVMLVHKKYIFESVAMWFISMLLIGMAILIITIYFSNEIADYILKPIYYMICVVNKNKSGELTYMQFDEDDEYSKLSENFNELLDIKELDKNRQLELKEMQFKALQAQITPHFLFNTLNLISMMANESGVKEISKITISLSKLLTILMGETRNVVEFSEEISYFKCYLSIIEKRYEDEIRVNLMFDENLSDCLVVPLTLQVIIENSIKHGKFMDDILYVNIEIIQIGDNIEISVEDNGIGINEKKVDEMNQSFLNCFEIKSGNTKRDSGLENLNKRIKLQFGEKYGLFVSSTENEYFKVTLTMPICKKEDSDV